MKTRLIALGLFGMVLVSACGGFAGPYGHAEGISSACRRDTLIHRLTRLKATGRYDHPYSFADGPDTYPANYVFYFFCQPQNRIVYVAVVPGIDDHEPILLVSAKEPRPDYASAWEQFNHGLDPERQKAITKWFYAEINPFLQCK